MIYYSTYRDFKLCLHVPLSGGLMKSQQRPLVVIFIAAVKTATEVGPWEKYYQIIIHIKT